MKNIVVCQSKYTYSTESFTNNYWVESSIGEIEITEVGNKNALDKLIKSYGVVRCLRFDIISLYRGDKHLPFVFMAPFINPDIKLIFSKKKKRLVYHFSCVSRYRAFVYVKIQ